MEQQIWQLRVKTILVAEDVVDQLLNVAIFVKEQCFDTDCKELREVAS